MGPANTSWWKVRDLGGEVLSEFVNVGTAWTATSSYIYRDGTLLGRYAPGTSYPRRWFAVDHLGTPRRTFGESGSLIESASYFPFGSIATPTGGAEETLRFTGHERDAAIAGVIDYMHARFYAPGVGRFLSVDPKVRRSSLRNPQAYNGYSYAINNPINYVDPDGQDVVPVRVLMTKSRPQITYVDTRMVPRLQILMTASRKQGVTFTFNEVFRTPKDHDGIKTAFTKNTTGTSPHKELIKENQRQAADFEKMRQENPDEFNEHQIDLVPQQ